MVETVDSSEAALKLERAWSKNQKQNALKIMVQVNTSGENRMLKLSRCFYYIQVVVTLIKKTTTTL